MEEAGFIKGDKLDVLWDSKAEEGIIRRDNGKGKTFQMSKSGRGTVAMNWSDGMPRPQDGKKMSITGIDIKKGEIIFDLPTHHNGTGKK
jgi:hypothetical protein